MYNRRNKLLLSLAHTRKQIDVFNSEDLSTLIDNANIGELNEGFADEFLQSNSTVCELFENMTVTEGSNKLELFEDDTKDDVSNSKDYFDSLIQNEQLDISEPEVLLQTPTSKSISVTPVPCDYVSFGSSPINKSPCNRRCTDTLESLNLVVDRIQELNTAGSIRSQETNGSQHESGTSSATPQLPFQPSTSATNSTVEASSECSTPSSATVRKHCKFVIDTTKKKRQCKKDNSLDTKRKLFVNQGKTNKSRSGTTQQNKVLKPPCQNRKFKFHAKVTAENQNRIFNLFKRSHKTEANYY